MNNGIADGTQQNRQPYFNPKLILRMRDKVIHSYFGIDPETVWLVVKERIPKIASPARQNAERDCRLYW